MCVSPLTDVPDVNKTTAAMSKMMHGLTSGIFILSHFRNVHFWLTRTNAVRVAAESSSRVGSAGWNTVDMSAEGFHSGSPGTLTSKIRGVGVFLLPPFQRAFPI